MALYSADELRALALASIGSDVFIDRTCQFFGAERIRIGSHVRIDGFCSISAGAGGIRIGSHVHIARFVDISGAAAIELGDFTGLSSHVAIFSSSDDYSGGAMANPMVPPEFRSVTSAPVVLGRHVLVGAGSVIMPGVRIGLGGAVGALTFVNKDVPDFMIVSGNPMHRIGRRDASLLGREADYLAQSGGIRESAAAEPVP